MGPRAFQVEIYIEVLALAIAEAPRSHAAGWRPAPPALAAARPPLDARSPQGPVLSLVREDFVVVSNPSWMGSGRRRRRRCPGDSGLLPLSEFLRHEFPRRGILSDPRAGFGFLGRLDGMSSGLVMCALTYEAHLRLQLRQDAHLVAREYVALCHGHVPSALAELCGPVIDLKVSCSLIRGRQHRGSVIWVVGASPVSEAAAQDLGPTMVEEGVAPTAAAEVARPVAGRRLVRSVLAAATALLFGFAAQAASLHHACGLGLRVDGVHVSSAPEGADSADVMLDAGLVRPDWSPHRAWLRSATCQLRMRDLDVAVEAPDAQHQGLSRVKLHARTRVTSSVDLFGLGLRVPWTAWLPVDLADAKAPKMWMQRSGSVTRKGPWSLQSPNVTLERPALVGLRVPAGSFPETLDGLLGRASISLDAAVAYEESGDRSVRLTQAVNASLVIESDSEGGYVVSAPALVTGHVRPAAFAAALGKLLVGDSCGERGGVHRSVRMAAVAPSSKAAQCLGASHAVGWCSRRASAVHDLSRGARRLLGRRLARSLRGSAGERLVQQPPRDGRRLTGESTAVTFSELIYADGSEIDIELNATMTDNAIGFDLQCGMDEATQFEVHLSAADSAEAGGASLDLAVGISDVEVSKVECSLTDSTDETTISVLIKAPDSGDTIASVSASSSASAGESLSARVYNPEDGTEFITITGTNSSASMSFSAVVKDPSDSSSTLLDASAGATYAGADTEDGTLEVTVSVGGEQIVLSGTLTDSYRTQGGFTMDASLSIVGSTAGRVDVDGTHDDTGLTAVALVEASSDGSYQQVLKLDLLILVTKSTNYTVHATAHDSSDTEMGTAGVSLTNEPTSGQVQDVDINMFSPMDSSLNVTMSVSLARGLLDMLTDAAEIPCLQSSCSVDVGLHSQHMDLVFCR
ncbi:unnamed protein product [Prorocentrum cordatum]|uniref:Uncharacterized protein n=1 Tax=Prorocentrum cordatum TaxID=2364126 RepID=A0ABN9XXW9_9DINO|nr:unnamed protein product [Polarella glacialis]